MILEIILIALAFIFMSCGIYSILFPPLPGIWIAWLGMFIFGLATNFTVLSGKTVAIFFVLTLLVSILEFFIPLFGAKKYKASEGGLLGSFLGSLIGLIVFGPFGVVLGMFAGLAVGEALRGKEIEEIRASLKGAFWGFLISVFIKLGLAAAMLAYLLAAVLKLI
ncbi:MAG: DUF456 domain-containing protein [Patescibacteria group bacterium]|nr:DUF456 domain-containing protein [Patescibacteria group bacterium]